MNYERIYKYRFSRVNQEKKKIIWKEISDYIFHILGAPERILDPAAGQCEFINALNAKEKWAVDMNEVFIRQFANAEVKVIIGNALQVDLPENYFDAVFISNFLEHLHSQEEVAALLMRMYKCIRPGGYIVVMGPNFKYTYRSYFDFADHTVILSELGLAEHIFGAGFNIHRIYPKFLPLSFRGRLPVNKYLTRLYLYMPLAWRFFGKQFLVIGRKEIANQ